MTPEEQQNWAKYAIKAEHALRKLYQKQWSAMTGKEQRNLRTAYMIGWAEGYYGDKARSQLGKELGLDR